MTRLDYELLASELPELALPEWDLLREDSQKLVHRYTREELIAGRAAKILGCDFLDHRGYPGYFTPAP